VDFDPVLFPVPQFAMKFLWIDFDGSGKNDPEQWYFFMPTALHPSGEWVPQDVFPPFNGDPVPLPNGNIQVHVGD
jgi:hypothetical protein